jgi:hypothetical protein
MTDIIKRRVYAYMQIPLETETCAECGQYHRTKNGRAYVFQYGTNDDWKGDSWQKYNTIRKMGLPLLFCSIECMRRYNGI